MSAPAKRRQCGRPRRVQNEQPGDRYGVPICSSSAPTYSTTELNAVCAVPSTRQGRASFASWRPMRMPKSERVPAVGEERRRRIWRPRRRRRGRPVDLVVDYSFRRVPDVHRHGGADI
jgi:hypothetical protein